jgi:asparagine synthase (glutamine-hydrolysing)
MFVAIAGHDNAVESHELARMASALRGAGAAPRLWQSPTASAGFAAAPTGILPEDAYDRQPIISDSFVFVCDARLDNRKDLATSLGIPAAAAAAMADSDILARCYGRWGEETPQHVYGDYAFVAWERESGRVVAATDHIGSIQLFYSVGNGRIFLATQFAALMAHSAVPKTLDVTALGLLVAPKFGVGYTMFKDVKHLPARSLMIFHDGQLNIRTWWKPDTSPSLLFRDERDYVELGRELFSAAVSERLRAVGNIAATMSGGLDSTPAATVAARQLAQSGRTLTAYTSVPERGLIVDERKGWDADDGPWASDVASMHPNMIHRLVPPENMIPLDILPAIHSRSLTPVGTTANQVWGWKINVAASRDNARVVLYGQRGNSTLSAVGAYGARDFYSPKVQFQRVSRRVLRAGNIDEWRAFASVFSRARKFSVDPTPGTPLRNGSIFLAESFRKNNLESIQRKPLPSTARATFIYFMMLPNRIVAMDSVAQFGVECRDPFADRRLMECVLKFPLDAFRIGRRARGLAREIGKGLLPDRVRLRETRGGQSADQRAWFKVRAADYRKVFGDMRRSNICNEILDIEFCDRTLTELCAGAGTFDYALSMHRVLDVGLFAMKYERGEFSESELARG